MLDLSVFNSYLIYKMNIGKKIKFLDYCLQLIREIFQTYSVPKLMIDRPSLTNQLTRFSTKIFIRFLYLKQQIGQIFRKNVLYVHTHTSRRPTKRTDSRYMCKDCDVGLCIVSCFVEYHTLLHFKYFNQVRCLSIITFIQC